MTSGYTLIDFRGVNLAITTAQNLSGVYAQLRTAMIIGKPLVGFNCVWGAGNSVTPLHMFARQSNATTIICTSCNLTITVTSADVVTVSNS